jgi:hypothetical protein
MEGAGDGRCCRNAKGAPNADGLARKCLTEASKLAVADYESEGRTFESFRARQHLAGMYRAKNYRVLRDLQGSGRGVL